MLRPRIIPCLLVKNRGLVKTVRFGDPKYVGDPINAVRIFNEKEVDELIIVDIDATAEGRQPDYGTIEHWAAECRMPLCYGGGVTTVAQVEKIVTLGVEKVAMSSAVVANPDLVSEAGKGVGSQSIVAVLDVRKVATGSGYEVFSRNGRQPTGKCPVELAKLLEQKGVGEIVINSIDQDGVMKGYDLELIRRVRETIRVPLTALGGAGALQHLGELIKVSGSIGAAAGSLFVFKGSLKAVLINYPNAIAKETLLREGMVAR